MKKLLPVFLVLLFCNPQKPEPYLSISLMDWNGKEFTLSNFKGKLVVIDFWATWCEPCKKSVPVIEALKKNIDQEKVVFYGINTDQGKEPVDIQIAAKKFGMTYDSLLDGNLALTDSLQITGLPALVFLDVNGNILYRQYGISVNDFAYLSHKLKNWSNR